MADPNQTAANRPPATSERECCKCRRSFLGDEHHQFCGMCIVEVACEIAKMQSPEIFIHVADPRCDHVFTGWREFADGSGGETVCSKCGMGAMEDTLRNDPS